jgi:hypothetical protein
LDVVPTVAEFPFELLEAVPDGPLEAAAAED